MASEDGGATGVQLGDWLGTSRAFWSYTGGGFGQSGAHAPFGESYALSSGYAEDFTGQQTFDGVTYAFQERYYHSTQGRWLSPDPAGGGAANVASPQSWNRYAYVLNNPLRAVDPLGLDCIYLDDAEGVDHVEPGDCESETDNGYYVDGTIVGGANGINSSDYGTVGPDGTLNFYVQGQTDPTSLCISDCNGAVGGVTGSTSNLPTSGSVVIGASFDQAVSVLSQVGITPTLFKLGHGDKFQLRDSIPFCSVHVLLDPTSGRNGQPTTGKYHLDEFNPSTSFPGGTSNGVLPFPLLLFHIALDGIPDYVYDATGLVLPAGRDNCK